MTKLLEAAIKKLKTLPESEQDRFANMVLTELGFAVNESHHSDFEKRWANAITVEEARQISLAHLKAIKWKK